jgi:hypothetical protein
VSVAGNFISVAGQAPTFAGLVAYVGLGPGQEFIPYFFALLAWVGAMLLAVLQWPFFALLRRLRRNRGEPPIEHAGPPQMANVTEPIGESSAGRP